LKSFSAAGVTHGPGPRARKVVVYRCRLRRPYGPDPLKTWTSKRCAEKYAAKAAACIARNFDTENLGALRICF
jgi:hypothetical protein